MINKILGKIHRKRSKFSGNHPSPSSNSSMNSKKSEEGNKRSISSVDDVVSAPFSILNIGNNLDNKFLGNKNLRPDANSVSALYEALPSFRDVSSSEKHQLFLRKVKMCCVVFDFTDPTKNLKEKEIKRQTLLDLVEYMTTTGGKFTELLMQEVVRMVSANIFREFTPQPRENKLLGGLDSEDEEPAMDPAWPHLQVVYEFLLRFVASSETDAKVAKKSIDPSFVLKLLGLFDSEDPREREYLKTILHFIYGKFMVHRPFIRKSINNVFYRFIFEMDRHNGVAEFLEVLGSIINGFALPLKEEHKLFLVRILLPLHKPKSLAMYHQQLSYCITQFVEKDCKLADIIIRGLIKYWPVTNSMKEVLFLNELEEVLEATQGPEFQRCMVPLFHQISRSLNSLQFQTIMSLVTDLARSHIPMKGGGAGFILWNNDHIENLIRQNRKVILPIIFPALEKNARHHWNQSVHSLTLNVRKIFYDLDPDLFKACQIKLQNDDSREEEINERRESTWRRLEEVAAKNTTSNAAVLISWARFCSTFSSSNSRYSPSSRDEFVQMLASPFVIFKDKPDCSCLMLMLDMSSC